MSYIQYYCADGWMCGFSLKDDKKNREIRKLSGLEPVMLLIRGRTQTTSYFDQKYITCTALTACN